MPKLYTIGHSTHTLKEFLEILHAYQINHIVDVRTLPRSFKVPWFNKEKFKTSLLKQKISYTHIPSLGGLRHAKKDSINVGWYSPGFRGFADYMQTNKFFEGLKKLNSLIKKNKKVAIMCAESLPWRCHRSLIADAETVRHYDVFEIINKSSIRKHKLTSFAKVNRKKKPIQIYYPDYSITKK